jgi:molecular chaperone DnaJ
VSAPEDIYRVLGVTKDADAATVQRAYRDLALTYHPDRNPSDTYAEQKFAEASRAYSAWVAQHVPQAAQAPTTSPASAPSAGSDNMFAAFEHVFGEAFGRFATGNVREQLPVSSLEARCGAVKTLEVHRKVVCGACRATRKCAQCSGTGKAVRTQGYFTIEGACEHCSGGVASCEACDRGLVARTEAITVTVPAGVRQGHVLMFAGRGSEVPGRASGNLHVEVTIDDTAQLRRDGDDAVLEIAIERRHALFGGELEVDTLDGRTRIRVPWFVRDGSTMWLRGRGHVQTSATDAHPYRAESDQRGDQRVVMRVPADVRAWRIWLALYLAAVLVGGLVIAYELTR